MAQASFTLFANCMWCGRLPPQISIIHFILLKFPRGNGWCSIPLDYLSYSSTYSLPSSSFGSARLNLKDPHMKKKSSFMSDKRISFLEKEIQDLLVSAGCHRPNLESFQGTRSPYVQTRQQKEKNRRSLEDILPPPAPLPLPHPETSFCHSNSGRRLQVIIRQGPGVVLSSAVHFEIGARERPISPPLRNATGTNSSLRILRSGSAFPEVKQVS
ncbi:hypothetical protein BCON_0016g00620 [Botryotinia convoluta]|uniref:Uncharacterized protein n=1 Tax=Botryotinia convoluta TaxID=54673 RepID=A0A4Z1IMV6_9HELO|nr:hypothetical protein BCON_0016g00620 [Botryotinia convoluta]